MTTLHLVIYSPERGSNKGGLQEIYKKDGTWVRDFYKFMAHPSTSVITMRGDEIIMKTDHKTAYPMILSERWKK